MLKLCAGVTAAVSASANPRSGTILFMTNSNRSGLAALNKIAASTARGLMTRAFPLQRASCHGWSLGGILFYMNGFGMKLLDFVMGRLKNVMSLFA